MRTENLQRNRESRAKEYALRLQPMISHWTELNGKSRLIRESQNPEPFDFDSGCHVLFALDAGYIEITLSEIRALKKMKKWWIYDLLRRMTYGLKNYISSKFT